MTHGSVESRRLVEQPIKSRQSVVLALSTPVQRTTVLVFLTVVHILAATQRLVAVDLVRLVVSAVVLAVVTLAAAAVVVVTLAAAVAVATVVVVVVVILAVAVAELTS